MLTYEKYAELRDSRGLKDSDVCRLTGIAQGSISDWKHGRTTPKADKVEKIANALNIPVSVLTGAVDSGFDYLLSMNNDLRLVIEEAKDMRRDDLQFLLEFIRRMKNSAKR